MRPIRRIPAWLVTTSLACLVPTTAALAEWSTDPTVNNAVCTRITRPSHYRLVSDGVGGTIVSWLDHDLNTGGYDVYAQRISAAGTLQWAASGVPVCTNSALQVSPELIGDGHGGAIVVWQDNRNAAADIYAQRIDVNGVAQWATNGIPVCGEIRDQTSPHLASDGNGGAIVVWQDLRDGVAYRPFAQRLDASGALLWAVDGVSISPNIAETPQILSDGVGGAFVAWHQYASGSFDIYAQRLGANGAPMWGAGGVPVCTNSSVQLRPRLTSDATGGVIMAWEDYRNTSYSNIYLQRLNADGATQWAANGVAAGPNTLDQRDPGLSSDGSGGAFVAWTIIGWGAWGQRIGPGGTRQWATDGIRIGAFAVQPLSARVVTDGGTGAIFTWSDNRSNYDVFAQRVDAAGTIQWTENGVGVCTNSAFQVEPRAIADGSGGAILIWLDARNSATNDDDLYGQRINSAGQLGGVLGVSESAPSAAVAFAQTFPNPCREAATIQWRLRESTRVSLEVFDPAGRRVATLASGSFGAGTHVRRLETTGLANGVYYCQLRAGEVVLTKPIIVMN